MLIIENTFYSPILELYWKLFKAQGINPEKIFKEHHINIKELKNHGQTHQIRCC
jgi:hypothetical protein